MPEIVSEPFAENPPDGPPVRGCLHRPQQATGDGWVLTHGAGANCGTNLLVALANAFAGAGVHVLRCDLPFRQARASGPPHPSGAANDREGLRSAVDALRRIVSGRVFLGGHSYGGRQATMMAADAASSEKSGLPDGLILLSYPLHPPNSPEKKRIEHLPHLHVPSLFIHGTKDPFGSPAEMEEALQLIPGKMRLVFIEGAEHGLISSRASANRTRGAVGRVLEEFLSFFGG